MMPSDAPPVLRTSLVDVCDSCGQPPPPDEPGLIECPECFDRCCCRCIAGKNVRCFACEEGEEDE